MDQWIKAGKIGAEVLNYAKSIAKPGIQLLELAEKIEKKTAELGAKPAFPVNLSLNHIAAHYTPLPNDPTVYKEEDILKIDIGCHLDGHISDTALTVGNNTELIKASQDALKAAMKLATPGTELREIGKAIQEAIKSHGFSPIRNLSGHQIEKYDLHAGMIIPNFDNGDDNELEEGQIIAIEPFATTGQGKVTEGKPSTIYRLLQSRPIRDPTTKKILQHIEKEFSTLPFCKRDIIKKYPTANFSLNILERQEIIKNYAQLIEETKGLVSQAEHTVLVKDKPVILTKYSP